MHTQHSIQVDTHCNDYASNTHGGKGNDDNGQDNDYMNTLIRIVIVSPTSICRDDQLGLFAGPFDYDSIFAGTSHNAMYHLFIHV